MDLFCFLCFMFVRGLLFCLFLADFLITYWERADLLSLLCCVFLCFCHFPHTGVDTTSELMVSVVQLIMFKPFSDFSTDRSKAVLLLWIFFAIYVSHLCELICFFSVPCSIGITFWERADRLALLCVMFPCGLVTFQYGVSAHVWYFIVSIADLCLFLSS